MSAPVFDAPRPPGDPSQPQGGLPPSTPLTEEARFQDFDPPTAYTCLKCRASSTDRGMVIDLESKHHRAPLAAALCKACAEQVRESKRIRETVGAAAIHVVNAARDLAMAERLGVDRQAWCDAIDTARQHHRKADKIFAAAAKSLGVKRRVVEAAVRQFADWVMHWRLTHGARPLVGLHHMQAADALPQQNVPSNPWTQRATLAQVRNAMPLLTANGLGNGTTQPQIDPEEFEAACAWLIAHTSWSKSAKYFSSYHLKHCAERWAGRYVSNGALMAAAIALGIEFKHCEDPASPNLLFKLHIRATPRNLRELLAQDQGTDADTLALMLAATHRWAHYAWCEFGDLWRAFDVAMERKPQTAEQLCAILQEIVPQRRSRNLDVRPAPYPSEGFMGAARRMFTEAAR